nr:unnamed protein product [Digitaria exilis]
MILQRHGIATEYSTVHSDGRTSASSFTSSGRPFRISFALSPPPANSTIEYDWAGFPAGQDESSTQPDIIAAHGSCVLISVMGPHARNSGLNAVGYFLYEPAGGDRRLPLLRRLPRCYFARLYERYRARERRGEDAQENSYYYHFEEDEDDSWPPCGQTSTTTNTRFLMKEEAGVLRRGEDDVVVAQLDVPPRRNRRAHGAAELCVLRVGRGEWELKRVPIVFFSGDDTGKEREGMKDWWETDVAVPVGDRFLCFVDYFRGFLLYDATVAADVDLTLRYVPLPVEVPDGNPDTDDYGRPKMEHSRNLADAGDMGGQSTVRFVSIEPRCCCGQPGRSTCDRSRSAFLVTTWTLTLPSTGEEPQQPAAVRWVKNSVLDCDELWAQPRYGSLPRVGLQYPVIVSSDNPDVVCFIVYDFNSSNMDHWMLEVDTVSKVLRSVVLYTSPDQPYWRVPVKFPCC